MSFYIVLPVMWAESRIFLQSIFEGLCPTWIFRDNEEFLRVSGNLCAVMKTCNFSYKSNLFLSVSQT